MSELSEQIAADALKPQATSADGVSVNRRSLTEMMAVDDRDRNISATAPNNMAATLRGMCLKIVSPGGY